MVGETILTSYFAVQFIYPFLLIFTLIFAVLQKSKILGEDKRQIDALVALSIALISIAFTGTTGIIISLMPFLAVSLVILLVFMILYGFVGSVGEEGLKLSKGVKTGLGILAAIAVVIAVLVSTGQWEKLYYSLFFNYGNNLLTNVILIGLVIAAMALVAMPSRRSSSKDE